MEPTAQRRSQQFVPVRYPADGLKNGFSQLDSLSGVHKLGSEVGWIPEKAEQRLGLEGELKNPFDRYIFEWHTEDGTVLYPTSRSDYIGFSGFVLSVMRRFEKISAKLDKKCAETTGE